MSCSVCAGHSGVSCPVCGYQPSMQLCPDCGGIGMTPYKAFNIETREEVNVTRYTWVCLPHDEDEAQMRGEKYCRGDRDVCPRCQGMGEVEIE